MAWFWRYLHFLGGVSWAGGYVMLVMAFLPSLQAGEERLQAAIMRAIRVISMAGALTFVSGLFLIAWTRGYDHFGKGEWGGMLAGAVGLAVVLMGISDALLRPAVRKLSPANPDSLAKAKRWALISLIFSLVILAIMARLPFARP